MRNHAVCRAFAVAEVHRGAPLWVVIDDQMGGHAAARGWGTARVRAARVTCELPLSVRWRDRAASPGHWVLVRGTALPTPTGLRLTHTVVVAEGPRDRWRTWRAGIGVQIDSLFRERATLARALLIADQRGIDPSVRDRYADAGLVHLLSVSGLHVAILASAVLAIGRAVRIPLRWLDPMAVVIMALYLLLLGAPPPALRSGIMFGVEVVIRRMQRPVHPWTGLVLGAVAPTLRDPLVVHDLGWQLSVAGMAALVGARGFWRQIRDAAPADALGAPVWQQRLGRWLRRQPPWGRHLMRELLSSAMATCVTLPIVLWTFGRLSLVAPITNLVAAPLMGLLQPALFLAMATQWWPAMAEWIADGTRPLMGLLDLLAAWGATIPGAVLPMAPRWSTIVCLSGGVVLGLRATAARYPSRWMMAATGALLLALVTPWWDRGSGAFELHVLDVGQGDAVALRTPRGHWVLIDAGPRWAGGDAGRRSVVPYIRRRGGQVALFVLSHPHADHVGGAASVVNALRPAAWWEAASIVPGDEYRRALAAVAGRRVPWRQVRPGDVWEIDGVELAVLAPDSLWTRQQADPNNASVVLRATYGAHRFLLVGDAEREEEAWLLARDPEGLRADVLKVGHHGSRTSSTPAFLAAVAPRLAVVSVGAGNRYRHPAPETLRAFLDRKIPVLRTDQDGAIVIRSDGYRLHVITQFDTWGVAPKVPANLPPAP
jgi:competence protein ComEC